jgi:hypothetical protein
MCRGAVSASPPGMVGRSDHRCAPPYALKLGGAARSPKGLCPRGAVGHMFPAMPTPSSSSAGPLVQTLEDVGITHVVGIPDNTSAPLFDALSGRACPSPPVFGWEALRRLS